MHMQLRRSTALIDLTARARAAEIHMRAVEARRQTPVVQTAGLGMTIVRAPRTAVGSAYDVASRLFVRAGAEFGPGTTETYEVPPKADPVSNLPVLPPPATNDPSNPNYKKTETTMTKPAPSKNALGVPQQSMLGKVATVAIVAPFVAGPPVIGYLLFGWIGAGVGAVIAAPLALGLVAYTVMG